MGGEKGSGAGFLVILAIAAFLFFGSEEVRSRVRRLLSPALERTEGLFKPAAESGRNLDALRDLHGEVGFEPSVGKQVQSERTRRKNPNGVMSRVRRLFEPQPEEHKDQLNSADRRELNDLLERVLDEPAEGGK